MANPGSANMSFVATAKSEHVVTAAESVVEHCHYYDAAGYGSTNTKIPYLNDTAYDTLSTLGTVQNDSTNGWSFTASKKCVVDMNWSWSSLDGWGGLTKNSAALTTNFTSQSGTVIVSTGYSNFAAYNNISVLSFSGILEVGDVLRPHTNGGTIRTGDTDCHITIKATPANASVLVAIPTMSPGIVLSFTGTTAPDGFFLCDGSAITRTTYPNLFNIIGITHGQGDGSTTFNIPDYEGKFLRGVDNAASRDPDAASRTAMNTGGNTGDNVGSVQPDEFKSHRHELKLLFNAPGLNGYPSGGANEFVPVLTDGISLSGGNETRPINAYVNYIIKY